MSHEIHLEAEPMYLNTCLLAVSSSESIKLVVSKSLLSMVDVS